LAQRERDGASEPLLVVDEGDERRAGRFHAGNLAQLRTALRDRHGIATFLLEIVTAPLRRRHGPAVHLPSETNDPKECAR
ncbi:MAG: hypothetical protein Q8N53_19145, partial [Longimicrobiales bacterium]|nr:hypothetical protein [Longimicrobiales bacterium]